MGLSIAVFVPEGIVIASDGLAEIRNSKNDQGFLQNKQRRLFVYQNRFLINIHGNGFINGMPYVFFVEDIFKKFKNTVFNKVSDFAVSFFEELSLLTKEEHNLTFYITGFDHETDNSKTFPTLLLCDNGTISAINYGIDNNIVYNYHSIGHSLWLNKILLPTYFETPNGERNQFEIVEIDFSKYSIENAIDFAKKFMRISRELDEMVQLKQMVGDYITYGIITLDGNINILHIE